MSVSGRDLWPPEEALVSAWRDLDGGIRLRDEEMAIVLRRFTSLIGPTMTARIIRWVAIVETPPGNQIFQWWLVRSGFVDPATVRYLEVLEPHGPVAVASIEADAPTERLDDFGVVVERRDLPAGPDCGSVEGAV